MVIIKALEHWRAWAESCSTLDVYTDYKNLTYFTITKQLNHQQVRWLEKLGQYKFKIHYTLGKENE
jgi:hypothetical protein